MGNNVFVITVEPDWPHSDLCAPYSLSLLGGEPNQSLAASVLVPRDNAGKVKLTTRLVLNHMRWRLHAGQVRHNRRDDPAFGRYRFTWVSLETLACEMGLSVHQVKRELETLTKAGIIYRTRRGTAEPNSYRLTDAAFKLMYLMQWPVLLYRTEAAEKKEGHDFVEAFSKEYRKWFPLWVNDPATRKLVGDWHGSVGSDGQKLDPDTYGFAQAIWEGSNKHFLNSKAGSAWT